MSLYNPISSPILKSVGLVPLHRFQALHEWCGVEDQLLDPGILFIYKYRIYLGVGFRVHSRLVYVYIYRTLGFCLLIVLGFLGLRFVLDEYKFEFTTSGTATSVLRIETIFRRFGDWFSV